LASQVTVVPTGYAPADALIDDWVNGDDFCSTYEKNGFSDYAMISPDEVTALMTSTDLLTKTGLTAVDTWTNQINVELTHAQFWDESETAIASILVNEALQIIPVRRVTVT
jgi:hypothetical protein